MLGFLGNGLIGQYAAICHQGHAFFVKSPLSRQLALIYATLCAGTDAPTTEIADFNTACAIALGTSFHCGQSCACEVDPKQRDFLKAAQAGLSGLFRNVHDLVKPLAYDDSSHQYMAPPRADAYIIGFPQRPLTFQGKSPVCHVGYPIEREVCALAS